MQVDLRTREIRVDCETLRPKMPLEFFCVTAGGNEHESVLRTRAKPSNIHTALLLLGLQPGEPVKFSESTKKWFPPHGPPLTISVEFVKDGKTIRVPASRLMRDLHTQKSAPPMTWVFTGSRVMPDGVYAADVTGYVVTVVNFELSMVDVPRIASEAQETLDWEVDPDMVPTAGMPMTMIIQPLADAPGGNVAPLATPSTTAPTNLSDVTVNQVLVDHLRERWDQQVRPHSQDLKQAAQAQYEVLSSLRREQQRLIDEADHIQRLIDQLEQEWQQMTTPRPENPSP